MSIRGSPEKQTTALVARYADAKQAESLYCSCSKTAGVTA